MTDEGLILDIDLSGIDETKANVEGYPADLQRELGIAMEQSLQLLETAVKERTPRNTGLLADNINHQIISPFPDLVGSVGSSPITPYAPVIEYGRKPGTMPPVDAIKLWVVRKLGISGKEADSAAWGIAKNIAKRGFSPSGDVGPTGAKMFREGLEVSTPHINILFDGAVARATARANDQA
jgi:hypothetical protein